jgi:ubiquinone/menaquinone biosynthesis C-methylase UbiE
VPTGEDSDTGSDRRDPGTDGSEPSADADELRRDDADADLEAHYTRGDLTERLLAGLSRAGLDTDRLDREDLAGVTEFHLQGRRATRELASAAGVGDGDRVLDVGAGLGGPARTLAAEYGCRVLALDRTRAYCRAGRELTRRVGLAASVTHCRASASALPVDGRADVVWTQHLLPNVADLEGVVAEFARALSPGGRLAVHEVFAGPADPVRYPMPFAADPSLAHLVAPDRFLDALERAGFRRVEWTALTEETVAWYERVLQCLDARSGSDRADESASGGGRPPGLELVLGDRFEEMTRTMYRNLADGRLEVYRGVFELAEESARA